MTLAAVAAIGLGGCSDTHHVHAAAAVGSGRSWSAAFPGTVSERRSGPSGAGNAIVTWAASRGKETDAVTTSVLPSAPGGAALTARLEQAVNGSAGRVGGAVISRRGLRWLGHPAEDAVIATTDALYRERVTVVGRELYVVDGLSRASPPGFAGYEGVLRSFRLG